MTQTETATIDMGGATGRGSDAAVACSVEAAVQMPYPLAQVTSPTHPAPLLKLKRTETVATVRWDGALYVPPLLVHTSLLN